MVVSGRKGVEPNPLVPSTGPAQMTDTPAARFTAMAERIERNVADSFGGAFVIVDPAGNAIETLLLDAKGDAGQFWGLLKVKCDMMMAEIDQAARQGQAFGRGR